MTATEADREKATLRNVRALLAEAHHELWCLADRAVTWTDRRWAGRG